MATAENFYAEVTLGNSVYIRIQEIYQYNRGFSLRLYGYTGTETPQGQFAFEGIRQTLNMTANQPSGADYYVVDVPDVILYQPKTAHCYVYVTSDTHGQTIYDIVIPIVPREKPADVTYTPEEIAVFDSLLSELNSSKNKVEAITEVVYAGSGVMWAGYDDNNTLVFEKAMLDDATDAYSIAQKNGFDGSQADWNAFVDDLLSHATPDQAMDAATSAYNKAEEAIQSREEAMQYSEGKTQEAIEEMAEQINNAKSQSAEVSIAPSDWSTVSSDKYTVTKTGINIVTATNNVVVGLKGPLSDANLSDLAVATLECTAQANGSLTFVAHGEKPLSTLTISVITFDAKSSSASPSTLQYVTFSVNETDGGLYMTYPAE